MTICSFFIGTQCTFNKISEGEALQIAEEHFRINYKESFLNSTSIEVNDVYMVSRCLEDCIDDAAITVFLDKNTYEIIKIVD